MRHRITITTVTVLGLLGFGGGAAQAVTPTVTCSYDPSAHQATVLEDQVSQVYLDADLDGHFVAYDGRTRLIQSVCKAPGGTYATTTTTDKITIAETGPAPLRLQTVYLEEWNGTRFGPGYTKETKTAKSEVEVEVDTDATYLTLDYLGRADLANKANATPQGIDLYADGDTDVFGGSSTIRSVRLRGGPLNDTFSGASLGLSTMTGVAEYGDGGSNSLSGGSWSDWLDSTGDIGDVVHGEAGNDHIIGTLDPDSTWYGDDGSDLISFERAQSRIRLLLAPGVLNDRGFPQLFGIESAQGTRYGDLLTGTDGTNVIDGGPGEDLIFGFGGNDRLVGGAGSDEVWSGDGNDYLMMNDSTQDFVISGGSGTDTAQADKTDPVLSDIEKVIYP
jgi:Ca2+-binding RTX toxin-like protein